MSSGHDLVFFVAESCGCRCLFVLLCFALVCLALLCCLFFFVCLITVAVLVSFNLLACVRVPSRGVGDGPGANHELFDVPDVSGSPPCHLQKRCLS